MIMIIIIIVIKKYLYVINTLQSYIFIYLYKNVGQFKLFIILQSCIILWSKDQCSIPFSSTTTWCFFMLFIFFCFVCLFFFDFFTVCVLKKKPQNKDKTQLPYTHTHTLTRTDEFTRAHTHTQHGTCQRHKKGAITLKLKSQLLFSSSSSSKKKQTCSPCLSLQPNNERSFYLFSLFFFLLFF